MNCAIIGTSKISYIHLTFLIKLNFKKIFILSRTKNKADKFIEKYNLKKNKKIIPSKFSSTNFSKIDLIDICVKTEFHQKYLDILKKSKKTIFIEKPIVSLKLLKKKYDTYLRNLFKTNNKIITCYPMIFYAKSFLKKIKIKSKIKSFKIYHYALGKNKKENICIDLMPHALSFIMEICKNNQIKFDTVNSKKIKVTNNSWECDAIINDINCKFFFKQSLKFKNTSFKFQINDEVIDRETNIIDDKFCNFLVYKNRSIKITNPMEDQIKQTVSNRNNLKWIKKNQNLTRTLMKINYDLLYGM